MKDGGCGGGQVDGGDLWILWVWRCRVLLGPAELGFVSMNRSKGRGRCRGRMNI